MKRLGMTICIIISVMLLFTVFGATAGGEDAGVTPVIIFIEGSAFSPEVATIRVGSEVVWRNKDASPHTITADDGSFDSGALNQGEEFSRKFTSPGTIKYSCDIHAYMSGRIEVRQ